MAPAQHWALTELAKQPRFTVWYVMQIPTAGLIWTDMRYPDSITELTEAEYRALVAAWWAGS